MPTLYNQPTSAPTEKVKAGGYAGVAMTAIPAIVLILNQFGIIVPDDVQQAVISIVTSIVLIYSAMQTIMQFTAAYLKRSKK